MTLIDYSNYSTLDLLDALRNMDREAYPENYRRLLAEFDKRPDKDIETKIRIAETAKIKKDFLGWYSLSNWKIWIPGMIYMTWIFYGVLKNDVVLFSRTQSRHLSRSNGILVLFGFCLVFGSGLFRRYTLDKLIEYRKYYWLILCSGLTVAFIAIMLGQKPLW